MLDAHSIRIMKRTSECRINEHVWKRHNAYGRRSISCICWLPIDVFIDLNKGTVYLSSELFPFFCMYIISPRFLCRLTALIKLLVAVQRQSVLYTENSGFASPTLGQHISTFRGYRILFSIINLI